MHFIIYTTNQTSLFQLQISIVVLESNATAPSSCDFEKEDLCWWEQDPKHDFDWIRHRFSTPSSHIGTGPTHDHTLGPGNDGL